MQKEAIKKERFSQQDIFTAFDENPEIILNQDIDFTKREVEYFFKKIATNSKYKNSFIARLDLFVEKLGEKRVLHFLKQRRLWEVIIQNYELFASQTSLPELFEFLFSKRYFEIIKDNVNIFIGQVDIHKIFSVFRYIFEDSYLNGGYVILFLQNGLSKELFDFLVDRNRWAMIADFLDYFNSYISAEELFLHLKERKMIGSIINNYDLFKKYITPEELLDMSDKFLGKQGYKYIINNYDIFRKFISPKELFDLLYSGGYSYSILTVYYDFFMREGLDEKYYIKKIYKLYETKNIPEHIRLLPDVFDKYGLVEKAARHLVKYDQLDKLIDNLDLFGKYINLRDLFDLLMQRQMYYAIIENYSFFKQYISVDELRDMLISTKKHFVIFSYARFFGFDPDAKDADKFRSVFKSNKIFFETCGLDLEYINVSNRNSEKHKSPRLMSLEYGAGLLYGYSLFLGVVSAFNNAIKQDGPNVPFQIVSQILCMKDRLRQMEKELLNFQHILLEYTVDAVKSEMQILLHSSNAEQVEIAGSPPRKNILEDYKSYFMASSFIFCGKNTVAFNDSVGGIPWSKISRAGTALVESYGNLNIPLMDYVMDLQHNNGYYFDKKSNHIIKGDRKAFREFLNMKRASNVKNLDDLLLIMKRYIPTETALRASIIEARDIFCKEIAKIKKRVEPRPLLVNLTAAINSSKELLCRDSS